MTGSFVYAGDLARDLGFDSMSPAFWQWCKSHGLQGTEKGQFAFDPDKVADVVRECRLSGTLPRHGRRSR